VQLNSRRRGWTSLALFLAIAVPAGWYFAAAEGGLAAEPAFADEAAVLAQTRFYRLVAERRFDDPDWIDHAAYDHQPLYKYAIGFALHVSGQYAKIPDSLSEFHRWIRGGVREPEIDGRLLTARWTMLIGGAFAVAFVFCFVRRLRGTLAAILAAALFTSSPLVFTHARRSMIDLTAIGLCVGALCAAAGFAMGGDTRRGKLLAFLSFVLVAGLAPLAKWNASTGVIAATAVGMVAILLGPNRHRLTGLGLIAGSVLAVGLFVLADPYYWASPSPQELGQRLQTVDPYTNAEYRKLATASAWERGKHALDYRRATMASTKEQFPNDYLAPSERPPAIVLEGMGRWTLGNRVWTREEAEKPRALRRQPRDWFNAAVVFPLALIGVVAACRAGWRERVSGTFTVHWLLVAWIGVDLVILLANLTADWDRYYMSVVAWSSVAAAIGVHSLIQGIVGQLQLKPRELTPT
jgi:4-amino-4-deoxy-L-arabinose transferase-like glycosyltransferase